MPSSTIPEENFSILESVPGLIVSGANQGSSGVLDHSASYAYLTPFLGVKNTYRWNSKVSWSPHFRSALPLPKRGWVGRLTGPGFDVSGNTKDSRGAAAMGDGYAGFGLEIQHHP